MKSRMIWKDIARNKVVSLTTMLFITAAAALLSLAAILMVNLSGAIDGLMEDAQTPHFMQMHSGGLDQPSLEAFARRNSNVAAFQTLSFLNIDNSQIVLGGTPLTGVLQDNGFSVQSEKFDFLLGLDNKRIQPKEGELYVPVCYLRDGSAEVGDTAVVAGKPFLVAGFVRDSQMNSSLASSKRFVVSETDYALLEPAGKTEYLIEFRLNDPSELGAFETAYAAAGLPANGPTLTWPLFRMISAISDGIMIAVMLLVSVLVICIALLCIRFTLLAKMEEEYREIGVMKAIGMRVSDIRDIYLSTYAVLAAAGGGLGFVLSFLFREPMSESIRFNLGGGDSPAALFLGIGAVLAVILSVLLYVRGVLRRFRKLSAVEAIRFGKGADSVHSSNLFLLSNNRLFSVNFYLGLKDVLTRKRLYTTMLLVIVLASFIMIVPQNLYHTISDQGFVAYLGIGLCDLRVDIQQTSQIVEKTEALRDYMEKDQGITNYALLTTKLFQVQMENGTTENIRVELGDHATFPLQYTAGKLPETENEIALSSINAEELNKAVGDEITLAAAGKVRKLRICGIYSDITNGGKTAKAAFDDSSTEAAWSVAYANFADPSQVPGKIEEYQSRFPNTKVSSIDEYMAQTFGQTLRSVQTASLAAVLVAAAVTLLVTLLFIKLLTAKDRYSIGTLKAVGFTNSDVGRQYLWRSVSVLILGIFLGTFLAGTIGEKLASAAIASFGAASFRFTVNALSAYLLCPLILLFAALIATMLGTAQVGKGSLSESMKE